MRTTLTLDKDVANALRLEMRRSGQTFKETVNRAIRSGLEALNHQKRQKPYKVPARPLGLRPGLSYDNIGELLDQIEGPLHK